MKNLGRSKRFRVLALLLASASGLCTAVASATTLRAGVSALGGNLYRYSYTLKNDGSLGAAQLRSFDIAFPDAEITGFSALPGWDAGAFPLLGDDLFVADAIPGPGLALNASASFSIDFRWHGFGPPGSQAFTIYDPITFAVLETGITSTNPVGVPLPPLMAGVLLPLLLGLGIHLSKRKTVRSTTASGRSLQDLQP